jgi:hypothetical protein
MVWLMLPAQPVFTKARGVHAVVAQRSSAEVVRRVEVAAGVLIGRVGELEVQSVVVAHRVALLCASSSSSDYDKHENRDEPVTGADGGSGLVAPLPPFLDTST